MKRCSLIIHSVSGNIYIIGAYLKEKLVEAGVDARLYRVEDGDLHILAASKDTVNQYYEDILELPVASEETLLKSDMIIIGAQIFGHEACDLIAEFTVAVENGLTLEQVYNAMHPHPTVTEMILETCKRAVGLSFDKG